MTFLQTKRRNKRLQFSTQAKLKNKLWKKKNKFRLQRVLPVGWRHEFLQNPVIWICFSHASPTWKQWRQENCVCVYICIYVYIYIQFLVQLAKLNDQKSKKMHVMWLHDRLAPSDSFGPKFWQILRTAIWQSCNQATGCSKRFAISKAIPYNVHDGEKTELIAVPWCHQATDRSPRTSHH